MTFDIIRLGLDEPTDYRIGMATIANRTARLVLGGPSAVLLGQSLPIVTTGDLPSSVKGEATERPGGPTWFGPGVLLVAPIMLTMADELHEALLTAGAATCADYGVTTVRRPHFPGLWVERDGWRKIASIALAGHGVVVCNGGGLALLTCPDLRAFDDFEACGIPGVVMTSLAAETGRALTVAEVAETFAGHLERLVTPSPAAA